jgi:hypothetical protein
MVMGLCTALNNSKSNLSTSAVITAADAQQEMHKQHFMDMEQHAIRRSVHPATESCQRWTRKTD